MAYWHLAYDLLFAVQLRRAYHCVQWIRNATKFLIWHRKHFNFIFYLDFFFLLAECSSDYLLFVWSFLHIFFFLLFPESWKHETARDRYATYFQATKENKNENVSDSEWWKWWNVLEVKICKPVSAQFSFLPSTPFHHYYYHYHYYYFIWDANRKVILKKAIEIQS